MDGKVYPDQESAARAAHLALEHADMKAVLGETFELERSDGGWWWFCPLPDFPGARAKAFMGEAAVQALEALHEADMLDVVESPYHGEASRRNRRDALALAYRVLRASGKIVDQQRENGGSDDTGEVGDQ